MTRQIALLRAVNVGGNNRLAMADLARLAREAGATDVETYIQSGNLVYSAPDRDGFAARLEAGLSAVGVRSPVVTRTLAEWRSVAYNSPEALGDPTSLYVAFLRDLPAASQVATLNPDRSPGDRFVLRGRELYIRFAAGAAKTKITVDWLDRTLGTVSTMRNWNTVQAVLRMASD
jgi:uncharacterized protein (DUF1697 family)